MVTADPPEGKRHVFEVTEDPGGRLDSWLHERLPDLSRSALKRYIREGRVTVDGCRAKPSTSLRSANVVEIRIPPPPPALPLPEDIPLSLLHQDDSILVINKAPDIVVHPSPGGAHAGGTIVNALLRITSELSVEGGEFRPGIVHRLDRETSGVLVVARDDGAHRNLAAQFKERSVKKEYLALCHGHPADAEGEIDLPIGRSLRDRKKMSIRNDEAGKAAQTSWRAERFVAGLTWFRLFPVTGRTHQIRLHLKSIGHPIVCDATYGREKRITDSEIRGRAPKPGEAPILDRQALHAARLAFAHPATGHWLMFEAPLPGDLQPLWDGASESP